MANSYSKVYIQYVFSVKSWHNFLPYERDNNLCIFLSNIIKKRNCVPLAINHVKDHIHIFVIQHPTISMSKLMQELKAISSAYIKKEMNNSKFSWQTGYGSFSYSQSQSDRVIRYIENQQEHHKKISFKDEYLDQLAKFNIDPNPKYLFDFYDEAIQSQE